MSAVWRERRIPLSWGRLSVQVAGTGPPLLLLHGLGGSGRYWAGIAPLLAGSRTLIAPDLAGFGRSDKPRLRYTADLHLEAIDSLLVTLQVEGQVAVAGHSMGGILAALWASRHPPAVQSLAVVAAPFPRQQVRPHGVPGGHMRRGTYHLVQRLLPLVSPLVRSATYPRAVIADYLRHTVDSYQQSSQALIWNPAVAEELNGLSEALGHRPNLLLYSSDDTTIAGDSLVRWHAVLPRAEVLVVPGAHQLLLRDHFAGLAGWYLR
jgi:pimeloyl-ACP methyl ester carboxylesterase